MCTLLSPAPFGEQKTQGLPYLESKVHKDVRDDVSQRQQGFKSKRSQELGV